MNGRKMKGDLPMGKSDTVLSAWLGDEKRFADLYNGSVFQGRQMVKAENLQPEKENFKELIRDKDGILNHIERNRDIVMKWDDGIHLMILACENQEKIHYAMPVRTMLYDGLSYAEQIRQLKKKRKKGEKVNSDEFLSGMKKNDKLYPVSTLVFYYGDKPWDGSVDLHGLLKKSENPEMEEMIRKLIPNYHINLLDVNQIEDTSVYKTDLQTILEMLKYRQDKERMQKYVQEHEGYFRHVDRDTYNVIRVLLKAEKQMDEIKNQEKEEVDMCQALQEIFDDGRNEGFMQGHELGFSEGQQKLLVELVRDGVLSMRQAAEKAGKSEEEFKELIQK